MAGLTLVIGHQPGEAAVRWSTGPRPISGGITTRSPYVAPTQDMTAVANSLYVRAKGLSLMVAVAPGLTLTQPVTISTALISTAGADRITDTVQRCREGR